MLRRLLSLIIVVSEVMFCQTSPSSLLVTRIYSITSVWAGEGSAGCDAGIIDNRSFYSRRSNYHSYTATGSGNWSVDMQYSDTSCAGPWTSYGAQAVVNQASNPAVGYGNDPAGSYHPYIKFVFSGAGAASVTVTYSAAKDFFLSTSVGAVVFPLSIAQGGTGATTTAGIMSTLGLQYVSTHYDFAAQSPPENLIAGGIGQSITLTPCPLGVAGANTNHYIRLTGANAEQVLITGGTCTSGAATGTVTFTPANNHTAGAYTVVSATAGIQEAVNYIGTSQRATVVVPGGDGTAARPYTYVYAPVTIASSYISLRGEDGNTSLIRTQFTSGDAVLIDTPADGMVSVSDLRFISDVPKTGGAYLHIKSSSVVHLRNVRTYGSAVGIELESCNTVAGDAIETVAYSTVGTWLKSGATAIGGRLSNVAVGGSTVPATSVGLLIQADAGGSVAGLTLDGFQQQGDAYAISFYAAGGSVNEIAASNLIMDSNTQAHLRFVSSGGGGGNGFAFSNIRFGGSPSPALAVIPYEFTNGVISNATGSTAGGTAVRFYGARNWTLAKSHLGGSGNVADISVEFLADGSGNACDNVQVEGSTLGYDEYGATGSFTANYGLTVSNAAHRRLLITNNQVWGNAAAILNNATLGKDSAIVQNNLQGLGVFDTFPAPDQYESAKYAFPAQAPAGALSAGVAATVTMTPCPFGVAGANTNHYLYVTGAPGAAEAVLITGGTCTSGAGTGTVTFTPANNHTGAWTIASATAGIQEAIWATGGNGQVFIPAGSHNLYATITVPTATTLVSIHGAGQSSTKLLVWFADGDVIKLNTNGQGVVSLKDFWIAPQVARTSGANISVDSLGSGTIADIVSTGAYDGLYLKSAQKVNLANLAFYGCARRGLWALASPYPIELKSTNLRVEGPGTAESGVRLEASTGTALVGPIFTNSIIQGFERGIWIIGGGGQANEGGFANTILDSYSVLGVDFGGTSIAGYGWRISNMLAAGSGGVISINHLYTNVSISDLQASVTDDVTAISLFGAKGVTLNNVQVHNGGTPGPSSVSVHIQEGSGGEVCDNIRLLNSAIGFSPADDTAGIPQYGVVVTNAAHKNIWIVNSKLRGSVADLSFLGTGTGSRLTGNDILTGKPTCTAAIRASEWHTQGGAGVADLMQVCRKNSADAYAWLEAATTAATGPNYIATESGANNAIAGSLSGVPLAAGLTVTVKLAHTLQAGANTFDYNAGGAVAIKSSRNAANDIGTAYAATGVITLMYDGTRWLDLSQ